MTETLSDMLNDILPMGSVHNSVHIAMSAVAEIVVKSSCVLGSCDLTTGKPDSYVTLTAIH